MIADHWPALCGAIAEVLTMARDAVPLTRHLSSMEQAMLISRQMRTILL
jgi:hypothetical protein